MKAFFTLTALFLVVASQAQHSLTKVWESDTTLAIPESVLPHPQKDILFVSLIDGEPWGADGKGGIALLDKKGKIINPNWVTGLSAPKGMALHNGKLYVADLSDVVVINATSGKVQNRVAIEGAEGLNDVTVDGKGVVYVSDSKSGKVYRMEKNKATTYITDLKGVNGLRSVDNDLYILTAKDIYRATPDKQMQSVGVMEFGGDGIEPVGNGDFITSTWGGVVYYLNKDGKVETLLDTREQKKNTADIGYDPVNKIVYVPTFFGKSVVAYQLQ